MSKFSKFMDGFGSALVIIMFIVIMFLSILVLVNAFFNLHSTNYMIKYTLSKFNENWKNLFTPEEGEPTPATKAYLDQIESVSKASLQTNTISFLFQVFTLTLITAGIYILKKTFSNIRSVEMKIKLIRLFITNGANSYALANYFSNAYQISYLIKNVNDDNIINTYISLARDSLTIAKYKLTQAAEDQIGIERSQHASFLDYGERIRSNLDILLKENTFSKKIKERIAELIDISKECLELLRSSDFVKKFEKQLAILLDKASTTS